MSNWGAEEDELPTGWDRRVVRAMGTADSGRKWAVALGVIGVVVIVASLVGNYLLIYRGETSFDEEEGVINRVKLGTYLTQNTVPVAFGGILVALAIILLVTSARLDLDIVRDDEEETGGEPASDSSMWAPPPPAP